MARLLPAFRGALSMQERITLRNFEHLIGYTTTRDEFVAACQGAD